MNAHQPRVTPSHGYDGTYSSFQSAGIPIFGYDASANRFAAFNLEALAGNAAKFCQFTGKERDPESGLDYFGARYYGSALGRFTSPDWSAKPQAVPYANLADPQSLNLYSYVRNNPLGKADPDGHCSAPSGLKSGQVGVCIDYFISTKHVDEGMKLGHLGYGDNRGPTGTDTQGRYRTEVQLTITPGQSVDMKATPGISKTMVGPDLAGKQDTQSSMKVDDKGNMHIDLQTTAINGYQANGLPGRSGSIQGDVKLVVTPDGKVGTDAGGTRTPYPALEIYKYAPGQSPAQVLYAPQSSTSDDLNRGRVTPIPQVAPQ